MITLYHYTEQWGFDPSPFCLKTEAYLRLAQIPYRKQNGLLGYLRAPRRQLPYIRDDDEVIADSEAIIAHLKRRYGIALDDWLTPDEQAKAYAVQRMLEDGFYWVAVYSRWMEDSQWAEYNPVLFDWVPPPLRLLLAPVIRRDYRRRLRGQGLLRRPRTEIYELGERMVDSVAVLLGDRPYFAGDKVSSIDAVMYGFFGNVLFAPLRGPLQDAITQHTNIVAHLERLRETIQVPPPEPLARTNA